MNVALVGCGSAKLDHAAPACDLYTGSLFRMSRRWAELYADRWVILSAKHGVLLPETVVEPYNMSLADFKPKDRRAWAWTARVHLCRMFDGAHFTMLAGGHYRPVVKGLWHSDPFAGMAIGRRLHAMKEQLS